MVVYVTVLHLRYHRLVDGSVDALIWFELKTTLKEHRLYLQSPSIPLCGMHARRGGGGTSRAGGRLGVTQASYRRTPLADATNFEVDETDDERKQKNKYREVEESYARPADWDKDEWRLDPLERKKIEGAR